MDRDGKIPAALAGFFCLHGKPGPGAGLRRRHPLDRATGNTTRAQRCLWGLAGLLILGTAQGAGFALIEQNASGLGNAYAGQAAAAGDASTVCFNPAGLAQVPGRQVVVAGHLISPSARLSVDPASTLAVYGNGGNATVSLVDEGWKDAWRYSLGLNHHAGNLITWRAGVAYDQSPVPDPAHRTSRIPDADRVWLADGLQYRLSPASRLDFGYAHLFVNKARIDHIASGTRLAGTYDNHVDILSAQYTHSF